MTDTAELESKFWKALKSDRTVMLGLSGVEDGFSQPMTVQLSDDDIGPMWIFTARNSDLVDNLDGRHRALLHFSSKGHDVFAAVEGELIADNDAAMIDKLWNPYVAAWFEGGKDDPNLQLLRFEPDRAQIWENDNSLFAGARILMGRDPKQDYKDKVTQVRL